MGTNDRNTTASLRNDLRELQVRLQNAVQQQFNRRVSFGDLMTDRWQNAREYGWGEGTSCYDNVLVIGDVRVGRNSWIGPNVILDGSGGGLEIGDYCQISAGAQIYTHLTIRRGLSRGKEPPEHKPTRIGNGVYIGPNAIVQMGVEIGDDVVVGAMSLVRTHLPTGCRAWGCPARIITDGQ